jgi:hypothetical protein
MMSKRTTAIQFTHWRHQLEVWLLDPVVKLGFEGNRSALIQLIGTFEFTNLLYRYSTGQRLRLTADKLIGFKGANGHV